MRLRKNSTKGSNYIKKAFFLILFLLPTILFTQEITQQPKFALVIGNGAYTNISRLPNPVNDAYDMANALQELGFIVEMLLDSNLNEMENAITRFKNNLGSSNDAYGFFFYAGHGVQFDGQNFLIPVDADIPRETYLRNRAVWVQAILDDLNDAGNKLNIIVLDACRDNPFRWAASRSGAGSRGLAVIDRQPADSIIVYATSSGQVASDGEGRNGLFTGQLLNNIGTPGIDVLEMFRRTGADVTELSDRRQIPAIYSQFFGLAFLGDATGYTGSIVRVQPPRQQPVTNSSNDTWKNKWMYVGGSLGVGNVIWTRIYNFEIPDFPYYYSYEEEETAPLFVPRITADFNVLPFLSIELGFGLGFGDKSVKPVIPILAKLGGKIEQFELTFDAGYTVGAGFTLGGTAGMNIHTGILFIKFMTLPKASPFNNDDYRLESGMMGFLGYKIGVFDK